MSSLAPDFPMPSGYLWQYVCIRWLQQFVHPVVVRLAEWISWLGGVTFLLIAGCVLMWSVHRTLGFRVLYVLSVSFWLNDFGKSSLGLQRPVGIPGILTWSPHEAGGYALPSGHAQSAATLGTLVVRWFRRRDVGAVVLVLVLLIGISRVYLGLHWPLDVLIGWAVGLVVGLVGWALGRWWTYREIPYRLRLLLALLAPAAMVVIHPHPGAARAAALALGLGLGWLAEERYLRLTMGEQLWQRVCAAVIGIAGLVAVQWALNRWPLGDWWSVVYPLLDGLWAACLAPALFWLCGLYERRTED
ncbi:MAG: phosphatase PAP2 family protein [Thermoflavifilum sp.]|nr:phosphatase PAP2 family protein [Thermoflavifilum sp.]MCL6513674.1 phosphatase PAP2 family protein [Alicyclobacillus sp.]